MGVLKFSDVYEKRGNIKITIIIGGLYAAFRRRPEGIP
jgi:hypothetical protein